MAETKLIRDHHLWSVNTVKNISGNLTIQSSGGGEMDLKSTGRKITFSSDAHTLLEFNPHGAEIKLMSQANNSDYCEIVTGADGATSITTVDADSNSASLTCSADGNIILDSAAQVRLDSTTGIRFYEGGTLFGGTEVITGSSIFALYENGGASTDDYFIIYCKNNGATTLSTVDAAGADAHLNIEPDGHVEFDGCAVGFDKLAGTFSTSGVIGDGNDSTDIDFRLSNKYELELTNNISGSSEYINMIFPNTSGNFLLVISQDGSGNRTVHADGWVVYQSDGSTKATNAAFANGTDGEVRWAGGSAPTLTTTADKADIISIYWDADNQTAFAVASLNF